MPCDNSQGMGDAYRTDPEARRDLQVMKQELDKITSMLCSLLRALDASSRPVINIPPDIAAWFQEHRAYDQSQGRP